MNVKKKTSKIKLLDWLYGISCIFVVICYASFLLSCLGKGSTPLEYGIAFAVLAVAILPVVFRKWLKIRLKKAYRPLKILFCCGMCIYMATFLAFSTVILVVGNRPADQVSVPEGQTPVVVVFGCRAYGKQPGHALQKRLNRAAQLMENLPEAICVVSGSQGAQETLPEAEAMYHYLTTVKHIDGSRVRKEPNGGDTIENVTYTLELLEQEGIEDPYLLCVSSEFHTPRILLITGRLDLSADVYSAPSVNSWYLFTSLVREYMAYWKLLLFSRL